MYEWIGGTPTNIRCSINSNRPGCTANPDHLFPPTQPAVVNIEQFYLPDVVAKETPPAEFPSSSLKAQAVAARSFALWHIDRGEPIDSRSQAFIPYTFEALQEGVALSSPTTPCTSTNLAEEQSRLCAAVSGGQYMALRGEDRPIYAAYILDIPNATTGYPVGDGFNRDTYLKAVQEPISPAPGGCGVQSFSFSYGMSQRRLGRWARGNSCYTGNPDRPYGVSWSRWEQLLVHYYTNIDIRSANGAILTPVYRWNPLGLRLRAARRATLHRPPEQ
jgi:Stage II sporulation protein